MRKPRPFACANLEQLRQCIQNCLTPDLLLPEFQKNWSSANPTQGFCSVASEAAWFALGGSKQGWSAYTARDDNNVVHWWLQHTSGLIFDPTVEQYTSIGGLPPYQKNVPIKACGFMGVRKDPDNCWGFERKPSRRAQNLLNAIEKNINLKKDMYVFKR